LVERGLGNTKRWLGVLSEVFKKRDALHANGVTQVAVFSDSQAAIRWTENLDPGPGQPLVRWINRNARTLRESGIETEIHWAQDTPASPGMKRLIAKQTWPEKTVEQARYENGYTPRLRTEPDGSPRKDRQKKHCGRPTSTSAIDSRARRGARDPSR